MIANTNPETIIRYGVISGNSLDPEVLNDLFHGAGAVDLSYKAAYDQAKAEAGAEYEALVEQAQIAAAETGADREGDYDAEAWVEQWLEARDRETDRDMFIERKLEQFSDMCQIDEPNIEGEYEGIKYAITWLGGAPLVYSYNGPMTYVRSLCSPCVPNAADLDSGFDPHGNLCHAVPQSWIGEHSDLKLFFTPGMTIAGINE